MAEVVWYQILNCCWKELFYIYKTENFILSKFNEYLQRKSLKRSSVLTTSDNSQHSTKMFIKSYKICIIPVLQEKWWMTKNIFFTWIFQRIFVPNSHQPMNKYTTKTPKKVWQSRKWMEKKRPGKCSWKMKPGNKNRT